MKVAFVVQRCGREVNGGAELHCLQVAQRMARHWHTEILTTCAWDYMTWENHYPEGIEQIGPTPVRRFRVDHPRNVENFNRLSADLYSRQKDSTIPEQEAWMRAQGPISTALLTYLRDQKSSYDAFIFYGYLYATTYLGLPVVRDKAWLAPLAHDEWPIYFSMWDTFFEAPRGFIFNTKVERQFLQRRFPGNPLSGPIAAVGTERPLQIDSQAFRARYRLNAPFLLYVGRIDESKGCAEMFDYFIRWKADTQKPHKLVLLGREVMPIPFHNDILHLGFVSDEEKWAAMRACDWLIAPSPFESLSMALLEVWASDRPALVNGRCEILVEHCRQSHGGLWYGNFEEWKAALKIVDESEKKILGLQGRRYVDERYSWDRVENDYLRVIGGAD